jgi:hypothetical protein
LTEEDRKGKALKPAVQWENVIRITRNMPKKMYREAEDEYFAAYT